MVHTKHFRWNHDRMLYWYVVENIEERCDNIIITGKISNSIEVLLEYPTISKNDSPMLPSPTSSLLIVTSSAVFTVSLFTRIRGTLVVRCFFACSWIGSDDPRLTLNVTRVGILFSIDALFTRLWYWIVGWFDSPCYFCELRYIDIESNVILNGRCLLRFDCSLLCRS